VYRNVSMEDRFRYDCSGKWFKGNLHLHTTLSDGRLDLPAAAAYYRQRGYDFIAITDHMVPFVAGEYGGKLPLLVLDGIELHGKDEQGAPYHVVCIGGVKGIAKDMSLPEAMKKARAQGSLLVWAHPPWSGNSVADGLRHNFHGVEVYNYSVEQSIGKGLGAFHWDFALEQQPDMLGFATDDNHFLDDLPPQVGGWVMVNAPELSAAAIVEAIRKGNYYSSAGPEFKTIRLEQGNRVVTETSPVVYARLLGPRSACKVRADINKKETTEAHFRIPDDWAFARLEIEDAGGRKSWSNPLLRSKK